MTIPAPRFRAVEQHTGEVAARPALSEADELCRELDTLRELQTRIQELEAEVEHQRYLRGLLVTENAQLRQERDTALAVQRRTSW